MKKNKNELRVRFKKKAVQVRLNFEIPFKAIRNFFKLTLLSLALNGSESKYTFQSLTRSHKEDLVPFLS